MDETAEKTDQKPVRYYRKVIRIRGEDSPNVRHALAQRRAGLPVTGEVIVPGVLPWNDYVKRRQLWDPIRQCIGIDGIFYEGAEVLLFPPAWLNASEALADALKHSKRFPEAIGIDPAEGGDKTSMTCIDRYGIIEIVSKQTPDTSVIIGEAIAFMKKHNVPPDRVVFDRGGGKVHADMLRAKGYRVRTVGFGETVTPALRRGMTSLKERLDVAESRYFYKNRRAQMYGELRDRLDPSSFNRFAIPSHYTELRRQLSLIPLKYDMEGRLMLPPKNKRSPNSQEKTLVEILGCSPDEADSLVLALHGLLHVGTRTLVGALGGDH